MCPSNSSCTLGGQSHPFLSLPNIEAPVQIHGLSTPTDVDRQSSTGDAAGAFLANADQGADLWAFSPRSVRRNIVSTVYPAERVIFVKGKVEDAIPAAAPPSISVLRLDTDWYESTQHELIHLFPRLSPSSVLIIDDYWHWTGTKQAVDEFFAARSEPIFLARTDYTGRIGMKFGGRSKL